jgi:predicted phosphate transport protein (TIGR00153 family)
MEPLFSMFGDSPFAALKAHGDKAHECVGVLPEIFEALQKAEFSLVRKGADRIGQLETEADHIQSDLHERLTAKVLIPVNRAELFGVMEHQDSIADRAEDVAAGMTCLGRPLPEQLMNHVAAYLEAVLANCRLQAGILSKMDLLVESSFSGRDALTVSKLITELNQAEDRIKDRHVDLSRRLVAADQQISSSELIVWLRVIDSLAALSKAADHTASGIRLMLKTK